MKQTLLSEKYPIRVAEIDKAETTCHDIGDVVSYLKAMIAENDKVEFIGVFDHYAHTRRIGGAIDPAMRAAANLIFCFGPSLPNPQVLAVRPRAIGIAELDDKFVVSFMEAPLPPANAAMQGWVRGLRNKV
ncbi:MAG: hypothetical protein PHY45_17775 [Rhodocyclaceae bacterium]|nr:hypothetical protein [Rhodocyclaceae bacterium]